MKNEAKEGTIRVALVEDDNVFCQNVAEWLGEAGSGFQLAGIFASGEAALQGLPEMRPDVVLMDLNLPGMSGVECVRQLSQLLPKTQIMVLTVWEDPELIFDSLSAGATGFLIKRETGHLCREIASLHAGGSPMTPSVARKVTMFFRRIAPPPEGARHLTEREEQVLAALARGLLYKEIADEFGISFNTVRAHVRTIYEKLQVSSRREAIKHLRNR